MHTFWLSLHIAFGAAGLLAGPLAMVVRKRPVRRGQTPWHRRLGIAYQVCVAGLTVTTAALVAMDPGLVFLGLIAVGTQAAAVVGWRTAPSRRPGRVVTHVGAMCGSYISFVTAFLVVNREGLFWWILPTLVGSPLIAWASRRAAVRYDPAPPAAVVPEPHHAG